MRQIALAGATGYLGQHIAKELNTRGIKPIVLTRRWGEELQNSIKTQEVIEVDFRSQSSLQGQLLGVDVVISSLGITRQKDNLSYMDVDYQANLNLLNEAKRCGVKKFIYISALNGEKLRHIKIFQAKEKFVDALKSSGLEYVVVRPNGFFSDLKDFLQMAQSGRVYLFGKGDKKLNPIHGQDLANFIIDAIDSLHNQESPIGGAKTYTHEQIAKLAFDTLGKKPKITYLPDWIRKATLKILPRVSPVKTYGPIEFFLSVMGIDMLAPHYGECDLERFYANEVTKES